MMHEHCAFCGNLNLRRIDESTKKCPRCDWEGVPDRNSMEDINKLARGYRPGNKAPLTRATPKPVDLSNDSIEESEEGLEAGPEEDSEPSLETPQQAPKAADPRKSSFRMDDKEASTSQNLLANKQISDKSPKNRELIERLKNKSIRGADFM